MGLKLSFPAQSSFASAAFNSARLQIQTNLSPSPQAQNGKPADWLTDGGDIERSAWQKNERLLSTESVKNMKLLWKTKLDNEARQMHNLLPALIASNVTTASGPKQIVLVTGVSDNLYALDAETGAQLWKHHFQTDWTPPASGGAAQASFAPAASPRRRSSGRQRRPANTSSTLRPGMAHCAAWTWRRARRSPRLPNSCRPTASPTR